jgi:hypothetical protein
MRRSPSALLPMLSSSRLFSSTLILLLLASSVLSSVALAQGSKRKSLYDPIEEKDKDRPDKRAQWMIRGREAPQGQSAAALRLRAHQQKMTMRAARKAVTTAGPTNATPNAAGWLFLGPAPLVSDQDFYGVVSGRSTAIGVDPSDATGNTVYAGGASGGVWKSTNAAGTLADVTWTPVTDQQASLTNGAISVKSDGSVVLVGTGEPDNAIDSYWGVGILRSTDKGATWTLIPSSDGGAHTFAGLGFSKFAWSTASGSTNTVVAAAAETFVGDTEALLAGPNWGLYLSTDAGQTWTRQTPTDGSAPISVTDVTYNATAGKFFAAIQYHGLYSSTNGTNWTRLTNQPDPTDLTLANCPTAANSSCPMFRGQLTTVPGRNEMYFWYVDGADNDFGIWQSSNGGAAWTQIDETGITSCGDSDGGCGTQQAFYNLEISAVADGTGTDIYAGAVNLFKCKLAHGATTCSTLDSNLPNSWLNLTHVYGCSTIANVHPDEHGLDFLVVGGKDIIYFGNDGGVYRALDGFTGLTVGSCSSAGSNSFDDLNASIGSMTQFVSFSVHPTDQNILLGGTQDNGSPATGTATTSSQFFTTFGGDGGYNAITPTNGNEWFISTPDNGSDPGFQIGICELGTGCNDNSYGLLADSSTVGGDHGPFYTPYILDPQSPDGDLYIGTCRVWRLPSTGTAVQLSNDFDDGLNDVCQGQNSNINLVRGLAAGGPTDTNGFSKVVYATTEGLGPLFNEGTGGEVWVTTNAATTLMSNVTPPSNININYTVSSVAIDNTDATGKTAYVGIMGFNTSHVWKTTDAGGTGLAADWTDWSGTGANALPDSPVNALLVDSQAGQIYAGTDVGIFVSSTTSPSWTEVGPAPGGGSGYLPNVAVSAIRLFNSGGVKELVVSTYGRGIWEYALATAPSFTLAAAPSTLSIAEGSNGTSTITVTPSGGFSGSVSLAVTSTLPTGVTASFNPTSTGTTSVLTLTASGSAVTGGPTTVTVTGTSGSLTATTMIALTVTPPPDFTLSAAPSTLSIAQGTNGTSTVTVNPANGFTSSVALAVTSTLPTGVTASFNPTSTGTTSVLTLTASGSATVGGPTTVTITGTFGSLTHTTTIALTVTPPPNFTLSAAPTSLTITPTLAGGTSTVTVNPANGFSGSVALAVTSTLPTGVTASFNPTSTGTTSVLTLTASGSATASGPTTVTVTGTSGSLTHTTTIALTVNPPPSFTLAAAPGSVSIAQGANGTSTVTVTPGTGFTGSVSLAVTSTLPSGVTASFNPASTSTTSVLTLTASGSATTGGPTTVTITGTSGSVTQTTTVGLTVFGITVPGMLAAPAAANPGQSTSTIMMISPSGASTFASNVTYTCSSGLPTGASCSFNPTQINAGGSAQSVTITVQTSGPFTGAAGSAQREKDRPKLRSQNRRVWLPLSLPMAGIVLVGLFGKGLPRRYKIAGLCLALALTGFLVACGGGSSSPPVTVSVSPSTVNTLYPSLSGAPAQTQQFSATVNNSTSQTVTWAVSGTGNGSIDASGLYTAPATLPSPNSAITVSATSASATSPGTATVSLLAPTPAGTSAVTVTVMEGTIQRTPTFSLRVN